jgi:hypothetical protein
MNPMPKKPSTPAPHPASPLPTPASDPELLARLAREERLRRCKDEIDSVLARANCRLTGLSHFTNDGRVAVLIQIVANEV